VLQATLFAMLMALSNFGNAISKYVGTALVLVFGVSNSDFDNFIWVVVAKSLLMMTPILFVPFLIPDGCPQDDDEDDGQDDETTYGSLRQSVLGRRSRRSAGSSSRWSDWRVADTDTDTDIDDRALTRVTEADRETDTTFRATENSASATA
jgi:hypothetical protein